MGKFRTLARTWFTDARPNDATANGSRPSQLQSACLVAAVAIGCVRPRMSESRRPPWFRAMIILGVVYAFVGIVFAVPGAHVKIWRLAAWAVSAVAYAAHICYERFRLQNSPRSAALHVALAVALGAFGLAVGANIHSLSLGSTNEHRRLLLLALGLWPIITALPAFLVALGAGWVLASVGAQAK